LKRLRTAARRSAAVALPFGFLTVVYWLTVLAPLAVKADYIDGMAAYDGGDFQTAFEEWRPLAAQGDADAQVALAGLYAEGSGVPANPAMALYWYRRAAEAGHAVAQLNLGDFLARGIGAPRDLVGAYVWLSLAARQGRAWPELRRRDVAARMSPTQLREAKARLKAWRRE